MCDDPTPLTTARIANTQRTLRLRAGFPCRWSVWSANGKGWFPRDTSPARDLDGVPYFHGDDLVLDVPRERLTIRAARGMEYGSAETTLVPGDGETLVELAPQRIYDAAARGWYGGDLHVHLNRPPRWVADSQHGEDLHVINLLPGDEGDKEAVERWSGRDLPWSDETHVARVDLAHHALGPEKCHDTVRKLRERGALIGYANAFHGPVETPEQLIGAGDPEYDARLSVVDAALGLVDSFCSAIGSDRAYRRLIGAGNRVAAVAGTAQRLGPIGRERTYAHVNGRLTAESYADAVRHGRTFATTGPFLELAVEGHGPGATLDLTPGSRVRVTGRVIGPLVENVRLLTADGELAAGPPGEVTAELTVNWPTYVVAVAEGGGQVRAHTSPVYLDVESRRVAREEDVTFCLRWLELLEELVRDRVSADYLAVMQEARRVYQSRLA
ncbi:CehA/McbA family metallohydrolase [Nonomuraea sp. NEAU-A123]|uniref:CehA/McbA family metallohydrolase n=1 Tax=Nonomuraea sp. NEAU-A123 TaxID=2839649 RepID=UPI001BE44B9D|nr:CehA/McbA family metallohydrolase [Nonomuraea sp. NEAU-A123]MBT2233759.1 CehA/McbA family metallohydrolase [Nonomuraea sp. NEAU-A123]